MTSFQELFDGDMIRYGQNGAGRYIKNLLKYYRRAQTCNRKLLTIYYKSIYHHLCRKRGIENPSSVAIDKGLYLGHAYNITINPNAVIGKNCNIHKGVVIGQTNRGPKKGTPSIGDCVWIGINSAIVGGITIADDVLIAPNTYVNCDIPSHSVVYGNPCIIKPRENATENYINNKA